jgi:cytochrome P450
MTVDSELPAPPVRREGPMDPPSAFRRLRAEAPISRFRWPNGIEAWLVTRFDDVRAILNDPRVSVNRFASRPPSLSIGRKGGVMLPKSLSGMDPPEHTPRRALYVRELTVRRVQRLQPRITEIVDGLLDGMERSGPPVDLVKAFAAPIPSMVICELLGVPQAEQSEFQHHTNTIMGVDTPADQVQTATLTLMDYLRGLIRMRRSDPGDDILSRLTHGEIDGATMDEDELVGHAMLLLIAGHETTANMIALGALTLLEHPDQIAALTADHKRADNMVEELLRYHTVVQYGLVRKVTADISIGGVVIREGDWVVCSLASANRDESVCPHSDTFDTGRKNPRQVSFGYGSHQCAGQNLARLELKTALLRLFQRFPGLRVERPVEELPFRTDAWVYGMHELLVRW